MNAWRPPRRRQVAVSESLYNAHPRIFVSVPLSSRFVELDCDSGLAKGKSHDRYWHKR